MKKLIALTIAAASPLLISSPSQGSIERELPASIAAFYQDRTFVSLLSSDVEREQILDALVCDGTLPSNSVSLDYCNQLPPMSDSERLADVRSRIVEINQHLLNDSGYSALIVPGYLPGSGSMLRRDDPNVVALPSSANTLPAEVLLPENAVWQDENTLTVQVKAYPVSSELQARMTADYEASPDREIAIGSAASAFSTEYHQWVFINNQWMKLDAETHLLEPLP